MKSTILILGIITFFLVSCQKENPGPDEVFMDGIKFSPSSITVSVGTTVTWTNKESVTHTVTSDSHGTFDSGDIGKDQTFSYAFNTAGTYAYHCDYHSNMKATVIVE